MRINLKIEQMNLMDSNAKKMAKFLEYMDEIYVNRDFYSRGKIVEMAKEKYVELYGAANKKNKT